MSTKYGQNVPGARHPATNMSSATTFIANLALAGLSVIPCRADSAEPAGNGQYEADVIIVGAGIAGLVTAYELQKRGISTLVLEASAVPGGRVATANYGNGLVAEFGLQEIWSNNPILGIAKSLGFELRPEYEHCAHSTFMHGDKLFPDIYDGTMRAHWDSFLSPVERRNLEGWLTGAQDLYARARSVGIHDPRVRVLQDLSFEEWLTHSAELSELATAWLRLHVQAELASDWSQVSALYALLEMEIYFDGGAACYAIDGGNSRLIEALANESGPIITSARVSNIDRNIVVDSDSSVRVTYIKNHNVESVSAKRVVLAVPFHQIPQINIQPALSQAHEKSLQSLGYGQFVVVHLLMDNASATLTSTDGHEITDGILTNGPLGYVYGVVAENDPDAVFSVLVYGNYAKATHMKPHAITVSEILSELDRIQPGLSSSVADAYVYSYHPASIPLWAPGRSPLDEQSELLRRPAGTLYFAGDYTRGGHSGSAAQSGIDVAAEIAREFATNRLPRRRGAPY